MIAKQRKGDGVTVTRGRDDRFAQDAADPGPFRTDGSVSYAARSPRPPRRFALPALVVAVGTVAGLAAAVVIELL